MIFTNNLNKYIIGGSLIETDGHIGIPLEYTVLFDSENFTLKKGFGGTPIMIYVVNANVERIGTLSDTEISLGMINRGFVVPVFDYLNSEKAEFPALDLSVQGLRQRLMNGELFANLEGFGEGKYPETLVVPGVDDKVVTIPGGIGDPFGGDLSLYKTCAKAIAEGITALYEKGLIC